MHFAFLTQETENASFRYRVRIFLPYLERHGHRITTLPLPKTSALRLRLFLSLPRFDAVLVQRKLFQPWETWVLRRYCRRLVFDFDDAIFCRDTNKARKAGFHSPHRAWKFRAMIRAADLVLAGSSYLAEEARGHTNRPVAVLPTGLDPSPYQPRLRPAEPPPALTVIWIGSHSTLPYLVELLPALESCHREQPLRLLVVSDTPPLSPRIPLEWRPWSESGETRFLTESDVGIMPLPDDPWTRGKCGFKILQYFAAGIPVVASPVGANREIVTDGKNGLWASTPAEWAAALSRLQRDRSLGRRLGEAGRRTLDERYALARLAPELHRHLVDTVNQS